MIIIKNTIRKVNITFLQIKWSLFIYPSLATLKKVKEKFQNIHMNSRVTEFKYGIMRL